MERVPPGKPHRAIGSKWHELLLNKRKNMRLEGVEQKESGAVTTLPTPTNLIKHRSWQPVQTDFARTQ
jgi:hypothetical protein